MTQDWNKKIVKKQVQDLLIKRDGNTIDDYRYIHTLNVAKIAVDLAKANGVSEYKAWLAAMYHDVAKHFKENQIRMLVKEKDIEKFDNWKAAHGIASANYVKRQFHCTDKQVLNAIANHVMPPAHSPKLTMIIYCADKLDSFKDGRKYGASNEQLIEAAKRNLTRVFLKILKANER